jgi:PII-like signaling protein
MGRSSPHDKDKPLHLSHDASIMLSVIDTDERIRKLIPHLGTMVEEGLIAMSPVEVIRYARDAEKHREKA